MNPPSDDERPASATPSTRRAGSTRRWSWTVWDAHTRRTEIDEIATSHNVLIKLPPTRSLVVTARAASPLLPVDSGWVFPSDRHGVHTPAEQHPPPSGALTVVHADAAFLVVASPRTWTPTSQTDSVRSRLATGHASTSSPAATRRRAARRRARRGRRELALAAVCRSQRCKAYSDAAGCRRDRAPRRARRHAACRSPPTPSAARASASTRRRRARPAVDGGGGGGRAAGKATPLLAGAGDGAPPPAAHSHARARLPARRRRAGRGEAGSEAHALQRRRAEASTTRRRASASRLRRTSASFALADDDAAPPTPHPPRVPTLRALCESQLASTFAALRDVEADVAAQRTTTRVALTALRSNLAR